MSIYLGWCRSLVCIFIIRLIFFIIKECSFTFVISIYISVLKLLGFSLPTILLWKIILLVRFVGNWGKFICWMFVKNCGFIGKRIVVRIWLIGLVWSIFPRRLEIRLIFGIIWLNIFLIITIFRVFTHNKIIKAIQRILFTLYCTCFFQIRTCSWRTFWSKIIQFNF